MSECARGGLIRAVALIAATYVYFLIFAEFAFLELARPVVGDGDRLRLVMGALGAGGAVGSVLAARLFKKEAWGGRLSNWLLLCACAALAALLSPGVGAFGLAAAGAAVGLALGGATVTLATGLSASVPRSRLGLAAGLGTGAAYALCNLPWVFVATPATQTWVAIGAALLGSALASGLPSVSLGNPVRARGGLGWMAVWAVAGVASAAMMLIARRTEARAITGPETAVG
jgi:cytochrome c oxidase cbb3-type subunit 2